jgi:succinate dehydrogenase / fumarate reductase flavoprotein subunit
LLDLLVFGKSAAETIIADLKGGTAHKTLPRDADEGARVRLARLDAAGSGEPVASVRADLQRAMQTHCGVFRFPDGLAVGVEQIAEISQRVQRTFINDKSRVFNMARVEALEIDNLIEVATATMISAAARTESRGAHSRSDFSQRDDVNWLKHTLWYKEDNRLEYRPVQLQPLTAESIAPKARVY